MKGDLEFFLGNRCTDKRLTCSSKVSSRTLPSAEADERLQLLNTEQLPVVTVVLFSQSSPRLFKNPVLIPINLNSR